MKVTKKHAHETTGLRRAAQELSRLAEGIDAGSLQPLPDSDAVAAIKLIESLIRLNKALLELELLEEDLHTRNQQRGEASRPPRRAGISREAIEEIERRLGLRAIADAAGDGSSTTETM